MNRDERREHNGVGATHGRGRGLGDTLVMGKERTSVALSFPRCILFSSLISWSVAIQMPCAQPYTVKPASERACKRDLHAKTLTLMVSFLVLAAAYIKR